MSRGQSSGSTLPRAAGAAIAEGGCHVAINLNGYTRGARGGGLCPAARAGAGLLPGVPGHAGREGILPWLISDAIASPVEEEEACYAESLARMPHCYFVNDYRAAYGETKGK